MAALPLHVELAGRLVLVVGAGPVGRRRVDAALAAGATVRWVAPDVPADASAHAVSRRPYQASDVQGALLVFACAPAAVNVAVVQDARRVNALVVRADDGRAGDAVVPAVIRRGPLTIGISTGGQAPAATSVLRAALAGRVPAAWGDFVACLAAVRSARPPGAQRQAMLRRLARGPLLAQMERGERPTVEALLTSVGRERE